MKATEAPQDSASYLIEIQMNDAQMAIANSRQGVCVHDPTSEAGLASRNVLSPFGTRYWPLFISPGPI